jgi:transposase-like protein
MLYLLGLSYGAVALALEALGYPLGKTSVYQAVQAAGEQVAGLRREAVRVPVGQRVVAALGVDLTSVKCRGQWLTVAVSVDAVEGPTLSIDLLDNAETASLLDWVRQVAQTVQAQVLVSDDADGFKSVARDLDLDHQVCISHVRRNTEQRLAELRPFAHKDADGSLAALGLDSQQALADLQRLEDLIRQRQPAQESELADLHLRYIHAPPPSPGGKASVAYRLRMLFLDRWNLWVRLTRYRTWCGPQQQRLDGTNNACERAIGWWIKERYRTMRGYKRRQSVLNVSRLTAWAGNHLSTSAADLALVLA